MPLIPPFNFHKWIEENQKLLQPPIGAKLLYEDSMFVLMAVGGPNRRNDYHINQTEEFFFQFKGDMILKVVDNGEFKDVPIREGDMFLLPANIPHSPQRFENTVGLVIEQKRKAEVIDRLRWYCENQSCRDILYEEAFHVDTLDVGGALKPIILAFYSSEEKRTCKKCGFITQPPQSKK